jgi:hypothetical protein
LHKFIERDSHLFTSLSMPYTGHRCSVPYTFPSFPLSAKE